MSDLLSVDTVDTPGKLEAIEDVIPDRPLHAAPEPEPIVDGDVGVADSLLSNVGIAEASTKKLRRGCKPTKLRRPKKAPFKQGRIGHHFISINRQCACSFDLLGVGEWWFDLGD